jgi:acyl carrier protein
LIEGWQHFEDDERGEHPLLDAAGWRKTLDRNGLTDALSLPGEDSLASAIGQHVILARRDPEGQAAMVSEEPAALRELTRAPSPENGTGSFAGAFELRGLAHNERLNKVSEIVRKTICRVFQLEIRADELSERSRLSDLGMDSLIALELRGELGKALGLEGKISSTIAFDTGTVGELTLSLEALLAPSGKEGPRESPRAASRSAVTAEALENLTEEQVEEMLKERLSRR